MGAFKKEIVGPVLTQLKTLSPKVNKGTSARNRWRARPYRANQHPVTHPNADVPKPSAQASTPLSRTPLPHKDKEVVKSPKIPPRRVSDELWEALGDLTLSQEEHKALLALEASFSDENKKVTIRFHLLSFTFLNPPPAILSEDLCWHLEPPRRSAR
jgi:hypothetical protein